MSYGVGAALQSAVYGKLSSDLAIAALVGAAIYDETPTGTLPSTFISLGPEEVRDMSDATGSGANHYFTVSVITDAAGFQAAKAVAAAVSDALSGADFPLTRGFLVALRFQRASAKRLRGQRRIDLRFHARVQDN